MAKKIAAGIVFVIVTVILGMVLWYLLANVIYVSQRSGSLFPVTPFSVSPVSGIGLQGNPPVIDPKYLGELSPLYGKLYISKEDSFLQGDEKTEYIYIIANINNKKPVKLSGLVLQSLISNQAAIIPQGTETYILGQINSEKDIYLAPGEAAIVHSGKSPVNYSFKTNMCSAFLNDWLDFVPKFSSLWCPRPESILPNTVSNIKKYGDACMEAVRDLNRCEHFSSENKYYKKVSKECREFLSVEMTYNACVRRFKDSAKFHYPGALWYVYLGRSSNLWKDKYEAIRLMDEEGRTISAISY